MGSSFLRISPRLGTRLALAPARSTDVKSQDIKVSGGSWCVPAFGGWGGAFQYPNDLVNKTFKVELIGSTTAYNSSFPPTGSRTPIFFCSTCSAVFQSLGQSCPRGVRL